MILAQRLELEFWGEAMNTAVYIKKINIQPRFLIPRPLKKAWSGRKHDVSHLRILFIHLMSV
jgi:hypothetical protein